MAPVPLEQFVPPDISLGPELHCRSSLVAFIVGPSVSRDTVTKNSLVNSIRALSLNAEVVDAAYDPEHALLTPVGTPGVPHDPILYTVLDTPSYNRNFVIVDILPSLILKDASLIVLKLLSNCKLASNTLINMNYIRSALVDLLFHLLFTVEETEVVDTVNFSLLLGPASLPWHAVLAHGDIVALVPLFLALGLVDGASLISHVTFFDLRSKAYITNL
jgi:hypothetical protein